MTAANRARKVSYNRPFWTRDIRSVNYFFGPELPFVRFMERNGYDTAKDRSLLLNAKVFCSVGQQIGKSNSTSFCKRKIQKISKKTSIFLFLQA